MKIMSLAIQVSPESRFSEPSAMVSARSHVIQPGSCYSDIFNL